MVLHGRPGGTAGAEWLNDAARRASEAPEVRDGLAAQGAQASATTQEEFATFVRSESEKWQRVAEAAGVRVD